MSPDRSRFGRRRFLRTSSGIAAAIVTGGSSVATAGSRTARATSSGSSQEDELDAGSRYTNVYEESIDDVVLVDLVGDDRAPGGIGSGFVLDEGYVVTNQHVVRDASTVELQFSDESWRRGSVVGADPHSDLAVVTVDDFPDVASGLSFADAEPVIGQEVLALGNPLGLDASLSRGIVSGADRSLPSPTGFAIPAAIQTDASLNPGNSGGPLVTLDGDVLGIVFAGAGQTIGFAISSLLASRVVPELASDGEYDHPYMGVSVSPVGPQIAEANDLEEAGGVLVTRVVPNAPADGVLEAATETTMIDGETVRAGGDVIIAIDGREIPNEDLLSSTLALETSPGETVEIEIVRDGERTTAELTLESRPDVDVP
ncbi:S1C family serine protease [Natrarchaeobius chitinivorans]|uniref:PDZ domain-containing protein n=1 Tax=Natrarchaeobius chitinivorans TaxID=1679083 RepID=A0A3N6LQN2_NATCH|nr:trypsin-like peptidase domain-containing protein [Natrarchaeobius chitinivorans]RQG91943.1 PDZ domain-containing protein [Natrarchaeobius chitinivorans]